MLRHLVELDVLGAADGVLLQRREVPIRLDIVVTGLTDEAT